jgi:hypothetical protein
VLQKNQLLLRLLKLRVVVNGHSIYPLVRNKPVVIDMPTNPTKLVVTDGFHITSPTNVTYSKNYTRYFTIVCIIEDAQLIIGFILTLILYAMGLTSGIIFLQVLSLAPIFYFLFVYYIKRKDFIRIQPV